MTAGVRRLVQVVSELPPKIGGVGDYALGLARALRDGHGIHTVFCVTNSSANVYQKLEGFPVTAVETRGAAAFANGLAHLAGDDAAVLVQYVGYGFDENGAPLWLIDGLERWRQREPERALLTVFHELSATSWPWRRAFWYSRRQRSVAVRLARMSTGCSTSLELSANLLRQWRGVRRDRETVSVAAIPSSVGEPRVVLPLGEREPTMVVFGTNGSRRKAYREGRALVQTCALLGIREVSDIGPGQVDGVTLPASVAFRRTGALEPREVSALLVQARAGFLACPSQYLAKSSVFAAYCAHGVLPVLASTGPLGLDGIGAASHYWHSRLEGTSSADVQAIATRANAWYHGHDLEKHAMRLAQALSRSPEYARLAREETT